MPRPSGWVSLDTFVRVARTMLPRPVVPKSGEKTHGVWRDSAGMPRERIISGEKDQGYRDALDMIRERDPRRASQRLASHVEMKVLAKMIHEGHVEATVVINNRPCFPERPEDEFVCEKLLPQLLAPGQRLTVEGIDPSGRPFAKTYTGEPR